ncbi:YdeI/OmpD-associated family protein [Panacibacter sp. DH6]|uniref:YdeI/OmpD-associated family protein n=1 Tax=Panacibacter microcysteis TaxID=2793269 RepID=A0A931E684_9BACT|nr:DUF1801 domain-containing protein [Panacibacter microcysteis]MBG9377808.1 YdeI/OmpD-associated family protein [Panacibacter microcysteis]
MNPETDFFFDEETQWQDAYKKLRTIALDCGLAETLKWGCPCYTFNSHNVVLIHGFKEYCALLFFKGALLHDANDMLVQQTKNVQAARQIRFTSAKEITANKTVIKAYIYQAIEVEKAGLQVKLRETAAFEMPAEFETLLEKNTPLKAAFEALTPGRQRAYLLHFAQAKQSRTRMARIEKYLPQIMAGKGLNDA